MTYNPLLNTEIAGGAPVDTALFGKVKDNFNNHEARLIAEETDVNVIHAVQIAVDDETNIYDATNIEDALVEVMDKVNTHKTASDTQLDQHTDRLTTLETESERDNTTLSFLGICSINKDKFRLKMTPASGTFLTYSASEANKTGAGAMVSAALGQTLTYDSFMPVNTMMGVAGLVTYKAPSGSTFSYGLRCFDSNQIFLGDKIISNAIAGTGAFVTAQSHFAGEGVNTDQFLTGTRFVKPFIFWTNNTSLMVIDFISAFPMLFSQYGLFQ